MELRQLKYFLAVAEEGQITKAAKRLHVTQPPLSQQLIALEKELGIALLERGSRQVHLTEAGQILKKRAGQMLELLAATRREISETAKGISGNLAIGAISSIGNSLLPRYLETFHQSYPNISFHLCQGETSKLLELLENNLIEVGIVRFPVDPNRYHALPLPTEPMCLACKKSEAPQTETDLLTLWQGPLLLHQRHREIIVEYCRHLGFEPHLLCTSDDITPLLLLAAQGIGSAIVPLAAKDLFDNLALSFYALHEKSLATTSAVIWKKGHPLSQAADHFIALFQQDLRKNSEIDLSEDP
ncbi:MAG: LysR family transcriptional regulator [Sporomusaceae bacterium]|nr:LysR family transcriptional regulator [Sporomusaceae bacterium]